MLVFRTWAKRLGGGAVALLLALLVLSPSLDAITCAGDEASHAGTHARVEAPSQPAHANDIGCATGACLHGHAHPGFVVLAGLAAPPSDLTAAALRRPLPADSMLASIAPSAEDPPPRA